MAHVFRRTSWSFARSLVLIVALTSCAGDSGTGTRDEFFNVPVVGMSNGGFGFTVRARDWTFDQSFTPDMSGETLQVGLVITGYTGGTGQLSITDAGGASVFSQNLAGNLVAGNNTIIHGTPPFHLRVTTSRYTGIINLGINTALTAQ